MNPNKLLVKNPGLAENILSRLQKDISTGRYKPGDRIPPEPVLMKQFNVGRSTIREAIKTLAANGILKVQQGSGTFVSKSNTVEEPLEYRLRRSERQEVDQVRMLLEKEIVRLAVKHRSNNDIHRIESALQQRQDALAAFHYENCLNADIDFHTAIAEASHNGVLSDLYKTFATVLRNTFARRDASNTARFSRSHLLHEQLLQFIIQQNESKALLTVEQILKKP